MNDEGAELTQTGARHWLAMDGWTIEEAAWLLLAIDPRLLKPRLGRMGRRVILLPAPEIDEEDARVSMVRRAGDVGTLQFPAAPTSVMAWAKSKGIPLPASLILAAPASEAKPAPPRPLQRRDAQEVAILAKLRELGYDPIALPRPRPGGMSLAKKQVMAALRYSGSVMRKAWQRLRDDGRIQDA